MKTVYYLPTTEVMDSWIDKALREYAGGPFPWVATPDAPNSYADLKQWAENHQLGIDPLPVFDGGSDKAIYSRLGNFKFRAWHDLIHLKEGLSFKQADELAVASIHCNILRYLNAPQEVIKAVEADVAGQVNYYNITGDFVTDQKAFVEDCLKYGLSTVLHFVIKGATY